VAKPAAFAEHDLLIAVMVQHNNPSGQADMSTSADWTLEGNYDAAISDAKVFSHVWDVADPSTWSFAYKATADMCLGLFRITGADQAPVVTVTGTPFASTTASMDCPDLTPVGQDDLLLSVLCVHGNAGALTCDSPVGQTDLGKIQVANLYMAMAAAHEALPNGGNPGVRTWTNINRTGNTGGTLSIAIKSPASSDPLDPLTPNQPPRWMMIRIATELMRRRTPEIDPIGTPENGAGCAVLTATGAATKVASCAGTARMVLGGGGAETRTDVYIAQTFSSVSGDGGGDGAAITTARTQTGDWLVVAVTTASITPPTKPGTFSDITLPDNEQGTNFEVYLYTMFEPAAITTYTWTVPGTRKTMVGALVRGAAAVTLYDEADSLETASGTSHTSPSVTTLGANRLLAAFAVLRAFPTSTWAQTSGWLEMLEAVGADASTNMQVSLQVKPALTAGTYSDTFTCANAEPAIVAMLALISAVGGGAAGTAETGTARATLTGAGTATRTATVTGRCALTLAGSGTARKTSTAAGAATLTARGAATQTKTTTAQGSARAALTAAGTAAKTTTEQGSARIVLVAASTATKRAPSQGAAAVALRAAGGMVKTAGQTGRAALTTTGNATALKRAPTAGASSVVLAGRGVLTPPGAHSQAGSAALALRSAGSAAKSAPATARGVLGLRTSGAPGKRAPSSGRAALALAARGVASHGVPAVAYVSITGSATTTTTGNATTRTAGVGNALSATLTGQTGTLVGGATGTTTTSGAAT
jgi:hypothetical protein